MQIYNCFTFLVKSIAVHIFSYAMMLMCWDADPKSRPSFQDLPSIVEDRLNSISEYVEMSMLLEPYREFDCRI